MFVCIPDNVRASNAMTDSVLEDLLPHLNQAINELLDSLMCNLVVMDRNIMCQSCSMGFMSGECGGQSMVSIPLSSGNCLHTLSTQGQALSCTRSNQGSTAPAGGYFVALAVVILFLLAPRNRYWPTDWLGTFYSPVQLT